MNFTAEQMLSVARVACKQVRWVLFKDRAL
jgi:hypothetical protein